MRRALAIGIITLAIAGGAIAAFGWPGKIIAISLAPGLILGSVVAHVVDAWIGRAPLRVTFAMLGAVLGVFSAIIAMIFIGAANVPDHVSVERSRLIPLPSALVWEHLEEPTTWSRWDAWLGRIEPTDPAEGGARRYATTLLMGTSEVPAVHTEREFVINERVVWAIELPPGSALVNVEQRVELSPEGDGTRVRYAIAYELPNLTARALHAIMFARGIEATAAEALEALEAVAREGDRS